MRLQSQKCVPWETPCFVTSVSSLASKVTTFGRPSKASYGKPALRLRQHVRSAGGTNGGFGPRAVWRSFEINFHRFCLGEHIFGRRQKRLGSGEELVSPRLPDPGVARRPQSPVPLNVPHRLSAAGLSSVSTPGTFDLIS